MEACSAGTRPNYRHRAGIALRVSFVNYHVFCHLRITSGCSVGQRAGCPSFLGNTETHVTACNLLVRSLARVFLLIDKARRSYAVCVDVAVHCVHRPRQTVYIASKSRLQGCTAVGSGPSPHWHKT